MDVQRSLQMNDPLAARFNKVQDSIKESFYNAKKQYDQSDQGKLHKDIALWLKFWYRFSEACIYLYKKLVYPITWRLWKAANPADLLELDNSVGPGNDNVIMAAVRRCDLVVCAWGAFDKAKDRGKAVGQMMRWERPALFCLGKTKAGAPKHPLYLKSTVQLMRYGI